MGNWLSTGLDMVTAPISITSSALGGPTVSELAGMEGSGVSKVGGNIAKQLGTENLLSGTPAGGQWLSPEQQQAYNQYISQTPNLIQQAQQAGLQGQQNAISTLQGPNPFLQQMQGFNAGNAPQVTGYGGPNIQAQTGGFNISGAPQNVPQAQAQQVQVPTSGAYQQAVNQLGGFQPGGGQAMQGMQSFQPGGGQDVASLRQFQAGGTQAQQQLLGMQPNQATNQAQQQLAGTMGALGQFVPGAGTGTSVAGQANLAALQEAQKAGMAGSLAAIKEQGFAGGATAGGAGNLAAMAAAASAGQFAGQRQQALEQERQAALQAGGMQLQGAQAAGQLGLGATAEQRQALQGAGQLGLGASEQQLGAMGQAGQLGLGMSGQQLQNLGQQGQLGLGMSGQQLQAAGTLGGLSIDQMGQQLQAGMANQGANLQAQGMNIDASVRAAQLAQSGDIAGAQLALQGTGMNIDQAMNIARMNQQGQIANQGAYFQGQGLNLNAMAQGAGLTSAQQQAIANQQAANPLLASTQLGLEFGQQLKPGFQQAQPGLINQIITSAAKQGAQKAMTMGAPALPG